MIEILALARRRARTRATVVFEVRRQGDHEVRVRPIGALDVTAADQLCAQLGALCAAGISQVQIDLRELVGDDAGEQLRACSPAPRSTMAGACRCMGNPVACRSDGVIEARVSFRPSARKRAWTTAA